VNVKFHFISIMKDYIQHTSMMSLPPVLVFGIIANYEFANDTYFDGLSSPKGNKKL